MSSIYRSSSRMKRKTNNSYQTGSSAEEERLLKQAIELSKVDCHRGGVLSVPFGPTFYPTIEEFEQGPVAYVDKIRPIAEKYGICKIVPPVGWNPPFCVDMSSNKRFQTKKQLVHRLQEGIAMDDGEEYNPEDYLKMANEFTMNWRDKHYSDHGECSKLEEKDENKLEKMTYQNLERDYWNLVETNVEEVETEYGNDIDTAALWSGFPRSERGRCTKNVKKSYKTDPVPHVDTDSEPRFGTDEFYKESWWNVNNIANCPSTALSKMKVGINGINVPWLYFGSLFTTFCWHNEDNYLYSINYHHKGAPKLWYGVPGTRKDAEGLERVFKNYLSMKMRDVPDLLHHITTMFSPRLLQQGGVPVCKILQHPGEYVITFPRSFHGGFSLGPNIGEAVNFATNDWVMHGADASERYRSFSRSSVFSHDRLTMTMANHLKDQKISSNCMLLYKELQRIINEELCSRSKLLLAGVRDISNEVSLPKNRYDQLDNDSADYDDKRLCYSCKHVCFFSAVACECSQSKVSCLRHSHYMCRCDVGRKYLLIWSKKKELLDTIETVRKHWEKLKVHEAKSKTDENVTPVRSSVDDPKSSQHSIKQREYINDEIILPVVIKSNTISASSTSKSRSEIQLNYSLPIVKSNYSVLSPDSSKKPKLSNGVETTKTSNYIQMGKNNMERKMGLSTYPLTNISSNEI